MSAQWRPRLGAWPVELGVEFRVWAPRPRTIALEVDGREYPLERDAEGLASIVVEDARVGSRYGYRLDGGNAFPDPASRFQPEGVHALSQVVDPRFEWTDDAWRGLDPDAVTIYELHVGTFTPEGTFASAADHLDHVADLGVTAIEVDNATCALLEDTTVRCWGFNTRGEVGDGTTDARPTPVPVSGLTGVASITEASMANCAVLLDTTAWCWGSNFGGQLGIGTTDPISTVPVQVTGLIGVSSLHSGLAPHSSTGDSPEVYAILADG